MRNVAVVLVAAAVALVALEWSPLSEAHGHRWWHVLPGFDLLYGLAGCVAIVLVSKAIGAVWLQRDEDYYDAHHESVDDQ
jgi:hypothetical protein